MISLVLILLGYVALATETTPNAVTTFKALSAPTLASTEEDTTMVGNVACAAVLIVILGATLFPTERFYKIQVGILEVTGLTIGVYETVFCMVLQITTMLLIPPIAIVGAILFFFKATKILAATIAAVYPVSMIAICMLNLQSWFVAQILKLIIGFLMFLIYTISPLIFLSILKAFTYTLLTCCILELLVYKIMSHALTTSAFTFSLESLIARFFIAVMVVVYGFITPILNRLLAPNQSSKEDQEEDVTEKPSK